MIIPKIIHYCWFGHTPLPSDAIKCIKSWKKYCPDYEIKQWDERNFDVSSNPYAYEAYQAKRWAFVSDYARLKIIFDQGGIYLDTDVELLRPLDDLLCQGGFMGFQDDHLVASGLGFGAPKGHPVIKALLQDYDNLSFIRPDGSMDTTPCPDRNTETLLRLGLMENTGIMQNIQGIIIYPPEYFCPMNYYTGLMNKTSNTYSIHHYASSWLSSEEKAFINYDRRKAKLEQLIGPRLFAFIRKVWRKFKGNEKYP